MTFPKLPGELALFTQIIPLMERMVVAIEKIASGVDKLLADPPQG